MTDFHCQATRCRYDGGGWGCGMAVGALIAYCWLIAGIARTEKKVDDLNRRLDAAAITTNVEAR